MSNTQEQGNTGAEKRINPFPGLLILALVGVIFSAILVYHHTAVVYGFQTQPSSCNISEQLNCDRVAQSSYATFLGVPVASLGLIYGLFLGALSLFAITRVELRRECLQVATFVSTLALVPTLFLLAVSYFEIQSFCLYCLVLDLQTLAVFFLLVASSQRQGGYINTLVGGFVVLVRAIRGLFSFAEPLVVPRGLVCLAIIGTVAAVIFVPGFLVLGVFAPQVQRTIQEKQTELAISEWKKSTEVDLSLSDEGEGRDYSIGDREAPITIVEFSDFECPFCKRAFFELKKIVHEYPEVRLVMKNYPLDQSCNRFMAGKRHEHACSAAEAVRCAGRQGEEKFWELSEEIYTRQNFTADAIRESASKVGLQLEAFDRCIGEDTEMANVRQDIEVGGRLRLGGTPKLFVNNKLLPEANFTALREILDSLTTKRRKAEPTP